MLIYVNRNAALAGLGKKRFKKLVKKIAKVAVAPIKTLAIKPLKQAVKSKTIRKVAKVAAAGAAIYYGGPAALRLLQARRRAGGGVPEMPEMPAPDPMIPNAEPSLLPESYTPPRPQSRAVSYGPAAAPAAFLPDNGEAITAPAQADLASMLTPQNLLIGGSLLVAVLLANRRR